jgi:Tetratricopeptide repeat
MPGRKMLCLGVTIILLVPGFCRAQHGSGHMGHMHHHDGGGFGAVAVSGGFAGYGWPYFVGDPAYYGVAAPGFMTMGPAGFVSPFGPMPPPMPMRGPLMAPPPRGVARLQQGNSKPASTTRTDPARTTQLMTLGDRLLRAGNLKKAEERYHQALRVSSNQAAPYLRLAQVALARGSYTDAANRLREAETAEPGWILVAPDIQSLYGEPAEFSRQVARLESHLQAHPDDRDAWLVLGAQWFLSGRTTRAADIFLRLNDPKRKPDIALSAFLIASNQAAHGADDGNEPTR